MADPKPAPAETIEQQYAKELWNELKVLDMNKDGQIELGEASTVSRILGEGVAAGKISQKQTEHLLQTITAVDNRRDKQNPTDPITQASVMGVVTQVEHSKDKIAAHIKKNTDALELLFKSGAIDEAGVKLGKSQVEKEIKKLDADGSGDLSYGEMMKQTGSTMLVTPMTLPVVPVEKDKADKKPSGGMNI